MRGVCKMLITRKIEIDMGHRVPNHKSKCYHLHGHRYVIEVGVDDKVISTKGASNEGMVIDYGDLKQIMMDVIDSEYDHRFVMHMDDKFAKAFGMLDGVGVILVDFVPTAENLSKHWYNEMKYPLKGIGIKIHHVKIKETPNSTATYTCEDEEYDIKYDPSQKRLAF